MVLFVFVLLIFGLMYTLVRVDLRNPRGHRVLPRMASARPVPVEPGRRRPTAADIARRRRAPVVPPAAMKPRFATRPPLPEMADVASDPVNGLTSEQLCRLWRTSYVRLERNRSPHLALLMGELRRAVLDELAVRDPHGFARWLDSGARAASDPARHIRC